MTKLRCMLLLALAVVAAAALRLSARPIVEVAGRLEVPDDGSRQTAVVMIEGAVLILTGLWLHPATRRSVRWMAAGGTVGCLLLSAGAGVAVYGVFGAVPAVLYAGLVHVLSRDLLSDHRAVDAPSGVAAGPAKPEPVSLAGDAPASGWGAADTATVPRSPSCTPGPDRTGPYDTAPAAQRRDSEVPAVPGRRSPGVPAVPGWTRDTARARCAELKVSQRGTVAQLVTRIADAERAESPSGVGRVEVPA